MEFLRNLWRSIAFLVLASNSFLQAGGLAPYELTVGWCNNASSAVYE